MRETDRVVVCDAVFAQQAAKEPEKQDSGSRARESRRDRCHIDDEEAALIATRHEEARDPTAAHDEGAPSSTGSTPQPAPAYVMQHA